MMCVRRGSSRSVVIRPPLDDSCFCAVASLGDQCVYEHVGLSLLYS
jgi:hypothetical protein